MPRAPSHKNLNSKKPQAAMQSLSPVVKPPPHDQQQASLKCPRCDSSSTKFCYYNNYSFSQPRHFCKTCRRYWTNGGALRNVPVGGGSRKTKRLKFSSSSSEDFSVELGGLKLSRVVSPTLDFQLGGIEIPRVNTPYALTEGIYDSSKFPVLWGLNFPRPMVIPPPKHPPAPSSSASPPSSGEPVSMKTDGNLMSINESLSCINQDLHWKLQQQRLAALFRSAPQQENVTDGNNNSGPPAMEWFFGKSASFTSVTLSPTDNNHGNENTSCNNNNNGNSKGEAAVIHHHQGWGTRNGQQYG